MWEESWEGAVGGEKEELATITHYFHFYPRLPQALKLSLLTCHRLKSHVKTAKATEHLFLYEIAFSTAFHCIKAMFLTTDVFFFILWSSKYNGPVRIRSQYLDSHFVYILNVIHSQKTTLPVTITSFWNTVYFCLFPTGEELFPGRGSLTFYSSVASYSFYWPSWQSAANSSSSTLSRTSFWIFYPVEFN